MTHYTSTISPLRQRMIEDMKLRKLSPKTQADYSREVKNFTRFFLDRSPDTVTDVEESRRYQLYMVDKGITSITLNVIITGLRFFLKVTLDCGDVVSKMCPVHIPYKLLVILSREEAARMLASATNPKYQAALPATYEAIALKTVISIANA